MSFGLESKFEIFGSNCRVGKQIISSCVVPNVSMEVVVWGALLVTRSVIYLVFKAHIPSMATTAFTIPSGFGLAGLSFVFQQDNDPTHLQAV